MRISLIIIFVFSTLFSFSQTVRIEGVVTDSIKSPIELANVMAVNVDSQSMESYSITSDKGRYSLNVKANKTYLLRISFLGYRPKELTLVVGNENVVKNIVLDPDSVELEGVEIVNEMPVSIKGDTIVYNADSFTSGTERKLEDVLKKLPGVQVNADGQIEVEGKTVQKLMVEGKDFFDGDTKLGVKNIPADAIDKVQVLRNYNEVGALKGLENNEENVAMNIKLKKGKKNFWFGDVTAAGGPDKRYILNPKLFYYSPKYSINVIANTNNVGELPLTTQDYFKFTGGFRNIMGKGGSRFNVSSNDLGLLGLRNNRAAEILTKFGATNFSYSPTSKLTLSGFAIFSRSDTRLETDSRLQIVQTGDRQLTEENADQSNKLGLFKLSASYKPNSKLQIDYDALGKLSDQSEGTSLFRQILTSQGNRDEQIFTDKTQKPASLNQNFAAYYTLSDNHIFAAEVQHLYQDEDPMYAADLGENPFPDNTTGNDDFNLGIVNQPSGRFNLFQNRFIKTNKLDAKIDYYYVLTPKSNINLTLANTYSNQRLTGDLFQQLDNGTSEALNPVTDNDVRYRFIDSYLGLHYKLLFGKFTVMPGVSYHRFSLRNEQQGTLYNQNFDQLLPDFYALYQIKKSETLTYNYAWTNSFTDVSQLPEGYILTNYNSLFRGLRSIQNATAQSHSLRYFRYNMFNFENIFGFLNYTRTLDAVKRNAFFDGVNQFSTPFNSPRIDEALNGSGSYGRSFARFYKASLNISMNWSKFNNLQNATFITTESFTQSYTLRASTNFKNAPNIEFGYGYTQNDYQNQTFLTDRPFVNLDYYFADGFSFVAEYEFFHYYSRDKSVNNEYDFLSASLSYFKKGSNWEFKVSGTNLLNTTSLNDDSFSEFSFRTSQYRVQPRFLLFSVKYNL